MARPNVHAVHDSNTLARLLNSREVRGLVAKLQETRWTGRPGYPLRAMVGMALVKSLYALPTWSRVARLVHDHAGLRAVLGCAPSQWACYRFTTKLREHSAALADCMDAVLAALKIELPGRGERIAIDGSDLPAYANGQRFVSKGGSCASDSPTRTLRGATVRRC